MFPMLCKQYGPPFPVDYSMALDGTEYLYVNSWSQAPTDLNKHTISFWYKRVAAGQEYVFYTTNSQNEYPSFIQFDASDRIHYRVAGYGTREARTSASFTDTTGWHHVMCRMDTSKAAGSRLEIWHDGVKQATDLYDDAISLTYVRFFTNNGTNTRHRVGGYWTTGSYVGKLAEAIGVDGSWQDVTLFRDASGSPVDYLTETNVFGNNGFYFNASNNTHYGDDMSGNGNDYIDSGLDASNQSADTPTS